MNLEMDKSSLVLGCAQLGFDYGIANSTGKPSKQEAVSIISAALQQGINVFDTAQAYGESEKVLGDALCDLKFLDKVKVISKIAPDLNMRSTADIKKSIDESLAFLHLEQLHCMMLHRIEMLPFLEQQLGEVLQDCCNQGKIEKIGVSVYSVEEAERALNHPDVEYIQIPGNAWDNKIIKMRLLERAREKNKTVFVRSLFLQGLLLMSPEEVMNKLPFAVAASEEWDRISLDSGFTKHELALGLGKRLHSPLVIGADRAKQVDENAEMFNNVAISDEWFVKITERMSPFLNERILNPAQW